MAVLRELIQGGNSFSPFAQDIRRPYGSIARKLNVSEVTVRKRIGAIERSGVIEGWSVALNPELVGAGLCRVRVPISSEPLHKKDVIDKIKLVEGVLEISDYFGTGIKAHILYDDDDALRRSIGLISKLAGSNDLVCQRLRFPRPQLSHVSETDLKILLGVQGNPRRMLKGIADDARVSTKTVARTLDKLSNARAVLLIPKFDPRAMEGMPLADILIVYSTLSAKADADSRLTSVFGESIVRTEVNDPEWSYFQMILPNISSGADVLDLAKRNPGVKSAYFDLVQDCYRNYETIARQISSQLAVAKTAPVAQRAYSS